MASLDSSTQSSMMTNMPLSAVKKGMVICVPGDKGTYEVTKNVKAPDSASERRITMRGNGWLQGHPDFIVGVRR